MNKQPSLAEARVLAARWCISSPETVRAWMASVGIVTVTDLMRVYPHLSHAEAMDVAQTQFWRWATSRPVGAA